MGLKTTLASYYPGHFRNLEWAGPKPPAKAERTQLFRRYCQAVHDNLKLGSRGYVRDFDGKLYEISKSTRGARPLNQDESAEISKLFEDAKL